MKIENNKVIFESDDKTIKVLELALSILEKDPNEAFAEWVKRLSYLAMRKTQEEMGYPHAIDTLHSTSLTRSLIFRINRWLERPKFVNYNIIKAYFIIYDKNENHQVLREEMLKVYLELEFDNRDRKNEESFIRNFRMMCSDSAYGSVFNFDGQTQLVNLHPKIEEHLMQLKEAFMQ
jgi:hydroxymethylpyrimidine pyrophosphatase-like HAD family hydrolase